ncbi:MAG: hypothetical protein ACOC0Q_02165 [Wenzhouxiangella sp.]
MLDFLIVLGLMWLLAHLIHRYLIKEAGVVASLLVAFAFALLAPIFHLFLSVVMAAVSGTDFDPESWFSVIPMIASVSGIIAYLTIKTKARPTDGDDDHIEMKF